MNPIDILAYKIESFDSDCFREDLVRYNGNSLILFSDFRGIWCAHRPPGCRIQKDILHFCRFKTPGLNYYLYPALFLIDQARLFIILLYVCLRYRIKIVLVENTYVALIAGIFRVCHIVKKFLYLPGDWLARDRAKHGWFSYLGTNVVFPLFDYAACRTADVTLNCTQSLSQARKAFWGKSISRKEMLFQNRLEVKYNGEKNSAARNIAFIGNVRKDSGLDMVVKALPELKEINPKLKIMGFYNKECAYLQNLAQHLLIGDAVQCTGFLERTGFGSALSDCFCGINLLTGSDSYSSKTLPAKLFDYLQFLLPVIVTEQLGFMAEIIRDNKLGLVIKPERAAFINAVKIIFREHADFRKNIIHYINSYRGTDIRGLLTC